MTPVFAAYLPPQPTTLNQPAVSAPACGLAAAVISLTRNA